MIYYRLDARQYRVGDTIPGTGAWALSIDNPTVENILQSGWHPPKLERTNCVYMSGNSDVHMMGVRNAESKYCYQVLPLGNVERRDLGWIGLLQLRHPSGSLKHTERGRAVSATLLERSKLHYGNLTDDEIVKKYWDGEPSKSCNYEYIASDAKVTAILRYTSQF